MAKEKERFIDSPLFFCLGTIGIVDMAIQAVTNGSVRPIRIMLQAIFGG